ncbi:substrate-binding domain-containing protein [Ferrimicrobium sp.]|uniref:substrate-binding domain-containing protein n=1 Tax=Ferrimicrobium sp. TaxID=2926050 RepID=UPI00262EB71F|nr:substrate-binding domain-containing protein [Ferrimicrobium sp.]
MRGDRMRLARIGLGLSQQQLAAQVGVSRQAIAAIEAGLSDPSLKSAIALARALGVGVEELFSVAVRYPEVVATSLAPELTASRADFSWVNGRAVALPLAGDHSLNVGFGAAGATISSSTAGSADSPSGQASPRRLGDVALNPNREVPPALIIAGCDPALALLPSIFANVDPRIGCLWWPASNGEALDLLRRGLIHAAGFHVADGAPYPKVDAELFRFARWREGLAYRSESPTPAKIEQGLRLANRQPGSEARHMVDEVLSELGVSGEAVTGYDSALSAHALVGSAIVSRVADFGVTIEPVALEFGLNFQARATEDFVLAIPAGHISTPEIRALFRALTSQELRSQLGAIRGYLEVERSGEPMG